jgi:leucine dehydrogenase
MGATLNDETIPRLKAVVIAGAANNQLATTAHGDALQAQGVLYAPDYVLNAGGIIDIAYQQRSGTRADMLAHVERIGGTLREIFSRADAEGVATWRVADQLAEEKFQKAAPAVSLAS